jgi:hypothetical protein
MVRKIIQWVPMDGTRWRNEFVNGHKNKGVGVHYDVAPGGASVKLLQRPFGRNVNTLPTKNDVRKAA